MLNESSNRLDFKS